MPNHLTAAELNFLQQVLTLASQKGVFNGPDLPLVGTLWARIEAVLKETAAAEQAAQENNELG